MLQLYINNKNYSRWLENLIIYEFFKKNFFHISNMLFKKFGTNELDYKFLTFLRKNLTEVSKVWKAFKLIKY